MTQKKFTVGQEVWVTSCREHDSELRKEIVSKVGRKYVTVAGRKYDIDTHEEVRDVGEEGYLYLSESAYFDEIELSDNKDAIHFYFNPWSSHQMTLEQSRAILAILKGDADK